MKTNKGLSYCLKMRFTATVRNFNKLLDLKSMKMLDHYSQFNPSPLTIKQFIEFGQTATEEESFTFLRKEIPVRLSNIMKEINLLPGNLLQMPSTRIIQAMIQEQTQHYLLNIITGVVCSELQRSGGVRIKHR